MTLYIYTIGYATIVTALIFGLGWLIQGSKTSGFRTTEWLGLLLYNISCITCLFLMAAQDFFSASVVSAIFGGMALTYSSYALSRALRKKGLQ